MAASNCTLHAGHCCCDMPTYCWKGIYSWIVKSIGPLGTQSSGIRLKIQIFHLTHWGQVTHICVRKLTIIGSDNGLSPSRRQAIIWTNAGILLIGPLGANFTEILIEILTFSFQKMRFAKWRPFCLGLNEENTFENAVMSIWSGLSMLSGILNLLFWGRSWLVMRSLIAAHKRFLAINRLWSDTAYALNKRQSTMTQQAIIHANRVRSCKNITPLFWK